MHNIWHILVTQHAMVSVQRINLSLSAIPTFTSYSLSTAGAASLKGAVYGAGVGAVFLSRLNCEGTESSLLECGAYKPLGLSDCDHTHDASVSCQGQIAKRQVDSSINSTNYIP